jgi:hypothetical protein
MARVMGVSYNTSNRSCLTVVDNARDNWEAVYVCGSGLPDYDDRPRCQRADEGE